VNDNYLKFPELREENWKSDLAFPVDVLEYPNSEMASLYTSYISSRGFQNKIAFVLST
jgi:hypothetical protein